jgi:hypothetical protein
MSGKIIPAIAAAVLLGTTAMAAAQTAPTRAAHRFVPRTYDQVPYRPGPDLYNYAPGPAYAPAAGSCAFGPAYNDTHFDVWVGGDGC